MEDHAFALKIPISPDQYYLVSNLQKALFDGKLMTPGLAVLKINETVVNAGLANNTVNADENNQGVELMEADGQKHLDNGTNRADAGDLFPGSSNNTKFDNSTSPASSGKTSICDIGPSADSMTAKVLVSVGKCPVPGTSCGSFIPIGGADPGGWLVFLLPVLLIAGAALLNRLRSPQPDPVQQ